MHSFDTKGALFGIGFFLALGGLFVGLDTFGSKVGPEVFGMDWHNDVLARAEAKLAGVEGKRLAARFREMQAGGFGPLEPRNIAYATIADHLPEEGKFIGVDLLTMKLTTYEDGAPVATYDVLGKGKPDTRWETPSGVYAITGKEESHFSSIGRVYMPYSMHFFGNFFIHGWPYYPDGTNVPEGFSGGCVRLSTEDAAEVFAFAEEGVPLYVHDEPGEDLRASFARLLIEQVARPRVDARSFMVADLITGDVYLEREAHQARPIASITKLMTAVVGNETIAYNRPIALSWLQESYTVGDLYYPLILRSDNRVADAIAASYGTNAFLERMNAKARALGMYHTSFADPSGLSAYNRATAADLFHLARYLYHKKRFLLTISSEKEGEVTSAEGTHWRMANQNQFARDEVFVGGKLGFTSAARQTSLGIFRARVGEETRLLAVIILGSDDWKSDTRALLSWFSRAAKPVVEPGTARATRS